MTSAARECGELCRGENRDGKWLTIRAQGGWMTEGCQDVTMLAIYALGGLDNEQCEAVEWHLVGCVACAAETDKLVRVRTGLDLYRRNRLPLGDATDLDKPWQPQVLS
jgi:Putative zinc-finger